MFWVTYGDYIRAPPKKSDVINLNPPYSLIRRMIFHACFRWAPFQLPVGL